MCLKYYFGVGLHIFSGKLNQDMSSSFHETRRREVELNPPQQDTDTTRLGATTSRFGSRRFCQILGSLFCSAKKLPNLAVLVKIDTS